MTTKKGAALLIRRMLGTVLALGAAAAAIAQTVEDQALPDNTGLNIPSNLQIFGKTDSNIRKATAIVNETVITGTDVDQRVALVATANNAKLSDQDRERLRVQVLRQLIDETLQIQQAKTADITITKAELDQAYAGVAKNFNRTPAQCTQWLTQNGSSERSIRRQIEGELA